MAKTKNKVKKERNPFIKTRKRADGDTEVIITRSPQNTIGGRIVVIILAALLGLSSIIGLILVLAQL